MNTLSTPENKNKREEKEEKTKKTLLAPGTLVSFTGKKNLRMFFTVLEPWKLLPDNKRRPTHRLGLSWCHQRNAQVILTLRYGYRPWRAGASWLWDLLDIEPIETTAPGKKEKSLDLSGHPPFLWLSRTAPDQVCCHLPGETPPGGERERKKERMANKRFQRGALVVESVDHRAPHYYTVLKVMIAHGHAQVKLFSHESGIVQWMTISLQPWFHEEVDDAKHHTLSREFRLKVVG